MDPITPTDSAEKPTVDQLSEESSNPARANSSPEQNEPKSLYGRVVSKFIPACEEKRSDSHETQTSFREGEVVSDLEAGTCRPKQQADAFTRDAGGGNVNVGQSRVEYKTLSWLSTGFHMTAEIISLGILTLPHAAKVLGLVYFIIAVVCLGCLSTYAGLVYADFKQEHPSIASISDAGNMLCGAWGEWLFFIASSTVLIFILAAHIGAFSIAMNVLTEHGTCSMTFAVVGMIVSLAASLPRKLSDISWLSAISCVSIVVAAFVCLGSIVHTKSAVGAIELFRRPTFAEAMTALLNIILAFAGHVAFFGFINEMKEPREFKKSLYMMETLAMTMYLVFGIVVYCFARESVQAPALSSTTPLIKKIAYGLALPTIIVAGVLNGHIACKNIFRAFWEKARKVPKVVEEKSTRAWVSWILISVVAYVLAWVIAEAIPDFHELLALVSALFMGFFSYGVTGLFWLKINRKDCWSTRKMKMLTVFNCVFLLIGVLICACGLTASAMNLSNKHGGAVFSCADNSVASVQGN